MFKAFSCVNPSNTNVKIQNCVKDNKQSHTEISTKLNERGKRGATVENEVPIARDPKKKRRQMGPPEC